MDQSTHDVRRANWLNIVHQCQNRPSGISAKQWLAENDIKERSYYYWLRKLRKEAYGQIQLPIAAATGSEAAFVEVAVPLPSVEQTEMQKVPDRLPAAVIRYNGMAIELSDDISDGLLCRLLREVSHA